MDDADIMHTNGKYDPRMIYVSHNVSSKAEHHGQGLAKYVCSRAWRHPTDDILTLSAC